MKGELPGLRDPEGRGGAPSGRSGFPGGRHPPSRLLASLPAACTHAGTHLDEVLVNPLGESFLLHTVPLICERQGQVTWGRDDPRRRPPLRPSHTDPAPPPDWQRPRAQAQPAPSRQGGEQEAKPGTHCSIPPLSPDRDGRVQGWQPLPEPRPRAQSQSAQVPACPVPTHASQTPERRVSPRTQPCPPSRVMGLFRGTERAHPRRPYAQDPEATASLANMGPALSLRPQALSESVPQIQTLSARAPPPPGARLPATGSGPCLSQPLPFLPSEALSTAR